MLHELAEQRDPQAGPADLSRTIKALASLAPEPAKPEAAPMPRPGPKSGEDVLPE